MDLKNVDKSLYLQIMVNAENYPFLTIENMFF